MDRDGRRPLIGSIVILLIGLLVSWLVYLVVANRRQADSRIQFEREANQMEAKLQSAFDLSIEYLLAIPPFFQASDEVSFEEFRRFVAPAVARHPGVYGYEYVERVSADELEAFQARKREEPGWERWTCRAIDRFGNEQPLPARPEYFFISYCEPAKDEVLGIDLASHPLRGSFIEKAAASEFPVATPPVTLIEGPDHQRSLIAYAPHHRAFPDGERKCVGLAVLILNIEPVVANALQDWPADHFQLAIIDSDAGEEGEFVFKNFPGKRLRAAGSGWPVESLEIRFADQVWQFLASPSAHFGYARPPYWILLSGFALSALAAYSASNALAIGGLRRQVDAALELGQYRLGRKLGEGGMGVVYEAEHRMLARPAAIKLIQLDPTETDSEHASRNSVRLSRFEKEAKATAALESPHTISVYDFGKTPDGEFYYVMELLEGTDLSSLVKRFGPVPPARMIHMVRQVCLSLVEAHAEGLIHRDIKPANIFVCHYARQYDFVKVLDFGLVKSSGNAVATDITQPGNFVGTPAFTAPETFIDHPVDARADLYSLGCVMFWLLTGRAPFEAQNATAVMAKHLTEQPTSPRELLGAEIPEQLDAIVLQCLAKKPNDRPADARQLFSLLTACASGLPWTQTDALQCWEQEQRDAGQVRNDVPHRATELNPTISKATINPED